MCDYVQGHSVLRKALNPKKNKNHGSKTIGKNVSIVLIGCGPNELERNALALAKSTVKISNNAQAVASKVKQLVGMSRGWKKTQVKNLVEVSLSQLLEQQQGKQTSNGKDGFVQKLAESKL